jgi:acyl-CoA dehydrogenase
MRRDLFTEDHEAFRALARDFIEQEVVPAYPEWEKAGRMPRNVFKQMGALGILGMASFTHGGDVEKMDCS